MDLQLDAGVIGRVDVALDAASRLCRVLDVADGVVDLEAGFDQRLALLEHQQAGEVVTLGLELVADGEEVVGTLDGGQVGPLPLGDIRRLQRHLHVISVGDRDRGPDLVGGRVLDLGPTPGRGVEPLPVDVGRVVLHLAVARIVIVLSPFLRSGDGVGSKPVCGISWSHVLASETRRALLDVGPEAFLRVGRLVQRVRAAGLQCQPVFERQAGTFANAVLDGSDGLAWAVGQSMRAKASVSSTRRSAANRRSTRPMANAPPGSTLSPVAIIPSARLGPTSRSRRCVPPLPGMRPSFTSGSPSWYTPSAAKRRSQAKASSSPPPKALAVDGRDEDLAAAGHGLGGRTSRCRPAAGWRSRRWLPQALMSAPTEKMDGSALRTTTTATSGSSFAQFDGTSQLLHQADLVGIDLGTVERDGVDPAPDRVCHDRKGPFGHRRISHAGDRVSAVDVGDRPSRDMAGCLMLRVSVC